MRNCKKITSILLALLILFGTVSATAITASAEKYGVLDYEITDGEVTIKGSDDMVTGELTIPSEIEGLPVTQIDYNAFYNFTGLTSITIPDSVTSIRNNAFYGCSGLTSIIIPDSVTFIEHGAFDYTGYYNNDNNWKNGVLYIGNHLIKANDTISGSYTIKNGTKTIAGAAFRDCTGLTNITIPNSMTSIGDYAFDGCNDLTSITIPDSVTSINGEAFCNCSGLTIIKVDKDNKKYDSRNNCNAIIETSTDTLISGCKNTVIPDSVTSIGDHAFDGCNGLTSITIPDSVTSIGSRAFSFCTNLTSITIPDSVTSISWYVFFRCESLKSITIPDSVTSIGDSAFGYCSGLTNVEIGNGVTSIGYMAFGFCSGLTNIEIGNNVTSIDVRAFAGCPNLKSITIPKSVTEICYDAFGYNVTLIYDYDGSYYESEKVMDFKIYCYENTAGEQYAIDNGFDYELLDSTVPVSLTDNDTGVMITAPAGVFNGNVTMSVEKVTGGSSFDILETVDDVVEKSEIFSIETYVDGVKTQPNGYVTVKLPIPDGFDINRCELYYINTVAKKAEPISFTIEGRFIIFKTNHFSDWAIVQSARSVKGVSLGDVTIDYKSSTTLKPVITADSGVKYTVKYESSNPSVATVDKDGKVYGAKKGTAEIKVIVTDENNNTVTDTCKVTVKYSGLQWFIIIVLFGWIWYIK